MAAVLFIGTAGAYAQTPDTVPFDQSLELANTGDEEAQIAVARAYENGIDVRISQVKAADWYRKAADQGNPEAMFRLARILSKGAPGVDKNLEVAFKLYDAAARKGQVEAQNWLGYTYEHGLGVQQSYADAVEWYTKAADNGVAAAQSNLGLMYLAGKGVPRDYGKAFALFDKAAENGDAWGANNLGGLYEMGWGVAQDKQKALTYYNQAAETGNKAAGENLKRLSAALGIDPNAAGAEPSPALNDTERDTERPSVREPAAAANRDVRSTPPAKAQAPSAAGRAPARQPKKTKTESRTSTKTARQPPAPKKSYSRTSKENPTCSTSLFASFFTGQRLCRD
jgi:TPR repeat protein